ncbi:MAG: hypothetical protein ABL953_01270 [Ilumatobacteraceae bacterium]
MDTVPATTAPEATVPETAPSVPAPTVPALPALALKKDGIGSFVFGDAPAALISAITAELGAPVSDVVVNYTDFSLVDSGVFMDVGRVGYHFPVGRTVCWVSSLCVNLGGEAEALLSFVGWRYDDPTAALRSLAGVTIGSSWSEFPDMNAFATCRTTGQGDIDGVFLDLFSDGHQWLNEAGDTQVLPDPSFTKVTAMYAGEAPFDTEGGDCEL